jgi:hypothetical protein
MFMTPQDNHECITVTHCNANCDVQCDTMCFTVAQHVTRCSTLHDTPYNIKCDTRLKYRKVASLISYMLSPTDLLLLLYTVI